MYVRSFIVTLCMGQLNERFTRVILKSSYCARVRKTVADAFKLRL